MRPGAASDIGIRSFGAMLVAGDAARLDAVPEDGLRLTNVGDAGGTDGESFATPAGAMLCLAFVLRAFQQRPQRHSACQLPSGRCVRIRRHPIELVRVLSVFVSGERALQSTHVSRFCIGMRLRATALPFQIEATAEQREPLEESGRHRDCRPGPPFSRVAPRPARGRTGARSAARIHATRSVGSTAENSAPAHLTTDVVSIW